MTTVNNQTSTYTNRRLAAGYTLIEILIVILIISIVTTVSLMTISRNENRELEAFANELTQMVSLAEEQALLEPRVVGIEIAQNDIQFKSPIINTETKKTEWQQMEDHILKNYSIPDNVQISLQVSGSKVALDEDKPKVPPIVISTNGGMTPFVMYVGLKGQQPKFAIVADADGNVSSKTVS